jgi:hypothetical protein
MQKTNVFKLIKMPIQSTPRDGSFQPFLEVLKTTYDFIQAFWIVKVPGK